MLATLKNTQIATKCKMHSAYNHPSSLGHHESHIHFILHASRELSIAHFTVVILLWIVPHIDPDRFMAVRALARIQAGLLIAEATLDLVATGAEGVGVWTVNTAELAFGMVL